MLHLRRYCSAILITAALATFSLANTDSAPSWLQTASGSAIPSYDKEVPAVALLSEKRVTLEPGGKLVTTERNAVRILTKEGQREAVAVVYYLVSSGKVRDINAWMINPDKSVKEYGKKYVIDQIADNDDVYNEGRIKVIDGSGDAQIGSIFGYEITTEEEPLYYQEKWFAQDDLPALVSTYSLSLPAGWKAESFTFNNPEVKPVINGNTYTWELRNLGYIKSEPMSPSVPNIVPWLAINYSPEDPNASRNKVFNNWQDVSRWATDMYEPQVVINDEIAAKARELTADAKTELDKIKAIGTYVQNIQYISIDIDVGHGNGIRPRPSDLVMKRGYGDCKDKATLMRAMLKVLKIDAFPVVIYSGDPSFVRAVWASPGQFNHCIIAVVVGKETESPAILEHEALGRLLIFDATDDLTPVGDIPDYLQGSFGLILAGDTGTLSEMPVLPPDSNSLERNVNAVISEKGAITVKVSENSQGQSSKYERRLYRKLSKSDYTRVIERWLTSGATSAKLLNFEARDDHQNAGFDLDVEFSAPLYGQLMQDRLLIFKPAIVSRSSSVYLTEKERVHPIRLESGSFSETATFELPKNFSVDELPDPVDLKTSFGSYKTSYSVADGKLTFKRSMITKRSLVPKANYESVRDFYKKILDAEQSPVVLLRN
ncbi:MAG: DUF3857 domain-containing protein [Pyrinomonadaceae bacterium]